MTARSAQPFFASRIRNKSDRHYFLFFLCGYRVRFFDELIGYILHFFLAVLEIVLGYLAVLLHLLELIHAVSADRADGDLAILGKLLDILDYLAALILSQRREGQSDNLAVILRVDAEIGGLDSLLDLLEQAAVPRLDDERARIR